MPESPPSNPEPYPSDPSERLTLVEVADRSSLRQRVGVMAVAVGLVVAGGIGGYAAGRDTAPLSTEALASQESVSSVEWLPETVKRWSEPIDTISRRYDVDPQLTAIVMTIESGGFSRAKSEANAEGLMQITPGTARDIARRHLQQPRQDYDIYDPTTNIEFGVAYIAYLRDEFAEPDQSPTWDETAELVAAGYNGGPGAANRLYKGEGLLSAETVQHSRDVMNLWREREAAASPTLGRWLERGGQRLIDQAKQEQGD